MKTLTTDKLENGMIVRTWGMRVEIRNHTTHNVGGNPTVHHFEGLVLNPEEVNVSILGPGMRTAPYYVQEEYAPGTYWAIQGNYLARWRVE